jgi:hypothetical protein
MALQHITGIWFSAFFSRLDVLCIPRRPVLFKILAPVLEDCLIARRQKRCLFSVTHFAALFRYACDSIVEGKPLNFIKATRLHNPVPESFASHMFRLLSSFSRDEIYDFAIPMIASSILLDCAPPGMHCTWPTLLW